MCLRLTPLGASSRKFAAPFRSVSRARPFLFFELCHKRHPFALHVVSVEARGARVTAPTHIDSGVSSLGSRLLDGTRQVVEAFQYRAIQILHTNPTSMSLRESRICSSKFAETGTELQFPSFLVAPAS